MLATLISFGPQRLMLAIVSIASLVLCLFADTQLSPEGWGILFGAIVPAMPPLLFMIYGLDLMMSRIWRGEFGEEQKKRYDNIAIFNIIIMILLACVWLPVFITSQGLN